MRNSLAIAAIMVLAVMTVPQLGAQSQPASSDLPKFEVASIKVAKGPVRPSPARENVQPGGRYTTNNLRLRDLLSTAYDLSTYQWLHISDMPEWSGTEYFDIEAKADGNPTREQIWLMVRSLLMDRFGLIAHWETKQAPLYALVVTKSGKIGPQLHPYANGAKCIDPLAQPASGTTLHCGALSLQGNNLIGHGVTMDQLVDEFGYVVTDRNIVNQTGLAGTFDLSLMFSRAADTGVAPEKPPPVGPPPTDLSELPSIFTALQEQLGLKLEPQTGPVNVLVIDHVEEPSPN